MSDTHSLPLTGLRLWAKPCKGEAVCEWSRDMRKDFCKRHGILFLPENENDEGI